MKKVGKVLVVDDNAGIRSALKILLPLRFEAVEILPSPSQLISTVNSFQPDVILLDMNFNTDINTGNEGLFWLSELRSNNPNQKVILFTAYADISLAVEGMKRGAFDFIVKPWENERLLATLERAVAENRLGEQRALTHELWSNGLFNPVVFAQMYSHTSAEKADLQLEAAADMGALMIDGLCDGVWLMNNGDIAVRDLTDTAFAILQAARLRTSKTEYISCPGCGRTLYNLRSTIAKIKAATAHMKGLKIGIMGCIVNGPGEMADADYGYVGAGPGKISLYKQKMCVEKAIPESEAVEHLLRFIEEDRKA